MIKFSHDLWVLESEIDEKGKTDKTMLTWFKNHPVFFLREDIDGEIAVVGAHDKDVLKMDESARVTAETEIYIRVESNDAIYHFTHLVDLR